MEHDITFTKGDVFKFKFRCRRKGSGKIITEKPDKVCFTVKKYKTDRTPVLKKTLSNGILFDENTGYYHVTIDPIDTRTMDSDCNYYYDIEITRDTPGYVHTVIKGSFILKWEVSSNQNGVSNIINDNEENDNYNDVVNYVGGIVQSALSDLMKGEY